MLLFFLFVTLVTSSLQSCSNPLLNTFGFLGYSSPSSISGLNYCKSLQSRTSCCPAMTVNNFQMLTDQLKTKLLNMISTRDQYIIDTNNIFISDFRQIALLFIKAADQAIPKLLQAGSSSATAIQNINFIAKSVTDNFSAIKSTFQDYQRSRTTCLEEMIRIQAALWCLACDPDWGNKGVSPGPMVSISANLCYTIQDACYPYVRDSAIQSQVLQFRTLLPVYQRITETLYKIADGKIHLSFSLDPAPMPQIAYQPNIMPDNCDEQDCQWLCDNLLTNTGVNETFLAYGGGPFGTILSAESRRLNEITVIHRGLSGDSEWDPDLDEAGVNVTLYNESTKTLETSLMKLDFFVWLLFCMNILE